MEFLFFLSPVYPDGGRVPFLLTFLHGSYLSLLLHREDFDVSILWGGLLLVSPSQAFFYFLLNIKQWYIKWLLTPCLYDTVISFAYLKTEGISSVPVDRGEWRKVQEALTNACWLIHWLIDLTLHLLELDSQSIHLTLTPNIRWTAFQYTAWYVNSLKQTSDI